MMTDHKSQKVITLSQKDLSSPKEDSETQILPIKSPVPADWEFNDLLENIAKQMTDEDLEEMKSRVKGEGGLKRHVLEGIKKGRELFDILQKHQIIDKNNLLILQALLHRMQKQELFELAVRYAQTVGNVMHIKLPPKEPLNGYKYVQMHIQGIEFSHYTRSSLEAVRVHVARLMFVEPKQVYIAGIELSSSLLITIMVPEKFVGYLRKATEQPACIKEWTSLGVDYILIDGRTYNVNTAKPEMAKQRQCQKCEDMKQQLDNRDDEILRLKRSLAEYEEPNAKPEMAKQRQCQICEDMKQQLDSRDDEILRLKRSLAEYEEPNYNEQIFMKESILIKKGREPECVEVSNEKTPGKLTKDAYNGLPGDNWCKSIRNCSRISKSRPSATDNSMDGVNTILFCK